MEDLAEQPEPGLPSIAMLSLVVFNVALGRAGRVTKKGSGCLKVYFVMG
jgi:hypothetical protein